MRLCHKLFLYTAMMGVVVQSFVAPSMPSRSVISRPLQRRVPSSLQAIAPDQWTELSTALSQSADWFPSHLLSDATAAAAAANEDGGWWQGYLNIFKNTLLAVHRTIDPPLREIGITQTWGVSIAVFTASKLEQQDGPTVPAHSWS